MVLEPMMSHPFLLFPKYKDQISDDSITKALDLVESIVAYSQGNRINREEINRLLEKIDSRMAGTRLYPGGSNILFGWGFDLENIGSVIFKPYYNRHLTQLIIHYFTVTECTQYDKRFSHNNSDYEIKVPEVIGLAKIESSSRSFPTLMTREVIGGSLKNQPLLIRKISDVSRRLALQGFICDPYGSNWKIIDANNPKIIYYLDLLSSNTLKNVKERIAALLEFLS
jgi:hypothetical protein